MSKGKVLVIGGGPCGCAAAWEIIRDDYQVVLVEEKEKLGGMASHRIFNGNVYEYGTHVFHTDQLELLKRVTEIMDGQLIKIERGSRIHIKFMGDYYNYPLQGINLLEKLSPRIALIAALSFLKSFIIYELFSKRHPKNTEEYLIQKFGKVLYKIFFQEYSRKVWGVSCSSLDASFGAQRIPRSDIFSLFKKVLGNFGLSKFLDSHPLSEQVIGHIYYTEEGIGKLFERIGEEVSSFGGEIKTGMVLKRLVIQNKHIRAAILEHEGKEIEIEADYYVSTIPLPILINSISGEIPSDVLKSSQKLSYRSIALMGFLIDKPQLRKAFFTYYPKLTFNRLSEPTNHGLKLKQDKQTLVIAETVCSKGDQAWNGEDSFCKAVINDMIGEELVQRRQIIECHHYKWQYAYPIYTLGFDKNIKKISAYLNSLGNIHSTGRNGNFNYVNMHVAMQMGMASLDYLHRFMHEQGRLHQVKEESNVKYDRIYWAP